MVKLENEVEKFADEARVVRVWREMFPQSVCCCCSLAIAVLCRRKTLDREGRASQILGKDLSRDARG